MPLDADVKKEIMTEYATKDGDTGSPEVQIAMLRSASRTSPSTRGSTSTTTTAAAGCCCWSAAASGMLRYLEATDIERYRSLIKRLGLRR